MMTTSRRRFLLQSGQFAAAALASTWISRRAAANPLGKPAGIQLWTVNGPMQADAAGTLKKLRKIGYGVVELAGFGKLTAKQFRQLLDDAGLACPSAHLSFDPDNLGPAFEDAHTVGAAYATSGSLDALVLAKPARDAAKRAMSPCSRWCRRAGCGRPCGWHASRASTRCASRGATRSPSRAARPAPVVTT